MIVGTLGQAAIRTLLVVVCISITVHIAAIRRNTEAIRRWRCMVAQLAAALLGSLCLIWLLVTENNWFPYVAEYTGQGLPIIYRIAAFWGGNAGSLLFWCLILTLYGAVVVFTRHDDSERMLPWVALILTCITLFYTLVINFLTFPFQTLESPMPLNGLNPLLQNPGMTVHPVNVYLRFIGFSVPFAYALRGSSGRSNEMSFHFRQWRLDRFTRPSHWSLGCSGRNRFGTPGGPGIRG